MIGESYETSQFTIYLVCKFLIYRCCKYCKLEMSAFDDQENEKFIRRALQLANDARAHGNHPFGALLVHNTTKEIVAEAENSVTSSHDPTRHAEMNLVQQAWSRCAPTDIQNSTLYTSTEPCPMCCGAIYWSGIRRVVYSCSAATLGEIAGDTFCGPCAGVFDKACEGPNQGVEANRTTVVGPVLAEEGRAVHGSFWDFLKEGSA